jgi:hypothetical protein
VAERVCAVLSARPAVVALDNFEIRGWLIHYRRGATADAGRDPAGGGNRQRYGDGPPSRIAAFAGTWLPRLDTSRLRAPWLAEVAELLGLATILHAAGITCSQRLGDVTATLQLRDEAEAIALLGGQVHGCVNV